MFTVESSSFYFLLLFFSPQLVGSEEVSVYDLNDHPDFNYRPQTVVVRITDLQSEPKVIVILTL